MTNKSYTVLLAIIILLVAGCTEYGKELNKALVRIIGSDALDGYVSMSNREVDLVLAPCTCRAR